MTKWMVLVGPMMILLGSVLLYFLVEGICIQDGALVSRSSEVEYEANPVLFGIVAVICLLAGVTNLGIGVLLTKEALQKLKRER